MSNLYSFSQEQYQNYKNNRSYKSFDNPSQTLSRYMIKSLKSQNKQAIDDVTLRSSIKAYYMNGGTSDPRFVSEIAYKIATKYNQAIKSNPNLHDYVFSLRNQWALLMKAGPLDDPNKVWRLFQALRALLLIIGIVNFMVLPVSIPALLGYVVSDMGATGANALKTFKDFKDSYNKIMNSQEVGKEFKDSQFMKDWGDVINLISIVAERGGTLSQREIKEVKSKLMAMNKEYEELKQSYPDLRGLEKNFKNLLKSSQMRHKI